MIKAMIYHQEKLDSNPDCLPSGRAYSLNCSHFTTCRCVRSRDRGCA